MSSWDTFLSLTHLDEDSQDGESIGMAGCLREGLVFGLIPVHQVQLAGIRLSVDGVLRADLVRGAPMRVELLQHVLVAAQWASGQLRVLAVDIDAPAVAGIHQTASVLWAITEAQWLSQLTSLGGALGADVDGRLTLSARQWEELSPLLGSCG